MNQKELLLRIQRRRYLTREDEIAAMAAAVGTLPLTTNQTSDVFKVASVIAESCDLCALNLDTDEEILMTWSARKQCYTNLESYLPTLIADLTQTDMPLIKTTKSIAAIAKDVIDSFHSKGGKFENAIREWRAPRGKYEYAIHLADGVYDTKHDMYLDDEVSLQFDFAYRLEFTRQTQIDNIGKSILDRIFDDWSGGDKSKRKLLLDYLRCVIEGNNRGRGLLLFGPGGNGKSIYLKMASLLTNRNSLVQLNMHDAENAFMMAKLNANTTLIVGDELRTNFSFEGKAMSEFKQMIDGTPITINPKGRSPYTIEIRPCVLQAMNTPLVFRESNAANLDRWIYVKWVETNFRKLKRDSALDFDLDALLKDDDFIKTLFNYVLDQTEWFEHLDVPEEISSDTEELINSGDSVKVFVEYLKEQEVIGVDAVIPVSIAYEIYTRWLKDENPSSKPMSRKKFTQRLTDELHNEGYQLERTPDTSRPRVASLSGIDMTKWNRKRASHLAGQNYLDSDLLKSKNRSALLVNENLQITEDEIDDVQSQLAESEEIDLSVHKTVKVILHLIHDQHDTLVTSRYAHCVELE